MAEKYGLISTLNNLDTGSEFMHDKWPLHVTIVPWFSLNTSHHSAFINAMINTSRDFNPIQAIGGEEDLFGPDPGVRVRTLLSRGALGALHRETLDVVTKYGGIVDSKYVGDFYKAHVTDQGESTVESDEVITVSNMQLIRGDTIGPRVVKKVFSLNQEVR